MTENRFFELSGPFAISDIANWTDGHFLTNERATRSISNVASLDDAGPGDLTFFASTKYQENLSATKAGAILVSEKHQNLVPNSNAAIVVEDPRSAFADMTLRFFPRSCDPVHAFGNEGCSPEASVHSSARLEKGVVVEPHAVIGAGVEIGQDTVISAGAVIGQNVCIGRNCGIGPNASIVNALLGNGVTVHPGVRIGQDGFGYASGKDGHRKIPQIGRVIIQDDVEIGANSTIDRGALRDTIIGEGTRIDNLVQIGHNAVIGRHCLVVSQTGISGSATLGDFVVLGGQVGVADHVEIGAGTMIAASSNVAGNVPPGERWGGTPAKPFREWIRELMTLKNLAAGKRGK